MTRLDGKELVVNEGLIELMEATPDTVLTLTTGRKIVVLEKIDEIIERVVKFRRSVANLSGG